MINHFLDSNIGFLIVSLGPIIMGAFSLLYPEKVKESWPKSAAKTPTFPKHNPFVQPEFVESGLFRLNLVVGSIMLIAFGLVLLYLRFGVNAIRF